MLLHWKLPWKRYWSHESNLGNTHQIFTATFHCHQGPNDNEGKMKTKRRGRITFPASTTIQLPDLLSRARRICHTQHWAVAVAWHCCELRLSLALRLLGKKPKSSSYFSHRGSNEKRSCWDHLWVDSPFLVVDLLHRNSVTKTDYWGGSWYDVSHLRSSPASRRCRCNRTRRIYTSRFTVQVWNKFEL